MGNLGFQYLKHSPIVLRAAGLRLISKKAAHHFLLEKLSQGSGLPLKGAQWFGMVFKEPFIQKTHKREQKLTIDEIKFLLAKQAPELLEAVLELTPHGKSASIGQVHRAILKNGERVVVKVQYPNIKEEIEEQLTLLLKAASVSPARKFGFDVESYRKELLSSFLIETDYLNEAQNQNRARQDWQGNKKIIIPKVYENYSNGYVLVQADEESIPISQLRKELYPQAAENWISFFMSSLLEKRWMHGDLHGENYGFRTSDGSLVLYDFGSILEVSESQRNGFVDLMRAVCEEASSDKILAIYIQLGFDKDKLMKIRSELPIISRNFLRGFMGCEKVTQEMGAQKWWLRCAGPPSFLLIMRAVSGFLEGVRGLEANKFLVEHVINQLHLKKSSNLYFKLNEVMPASKSLHVLVQHNGKIKASIELPATAVEDLEDLLDAETAQRVKSLGYDLKAMSQKILNSGLKPQVIFESNFSDKQIRVWLK